MVCSHLHEKHIIIYERLRYILRGNERKTIEMKNLSHSRRISHGLSLLVVLLVLAGCVLPTVPSGTELPGSTVPAPTPASGAATATPGETPATLENTSWQLASFSASAIEMPVIADSLITLEFGANGEASGSSGCNSYGGAYEVQDDTLLFSAIASTLMACVDEDMMQQESDYLAALQVADRFVIAGDTLTLWYDSSSGMLTFVQNDPSTPGANDVTPSITPTDTLTSTASTQ